MYRSLHAVKAIAPITTITPPVHGRDAGQYMLADLFKWAKLVKESGAKLD